MFCLFSERLGGVNEIKTFWKNVALKFLGLNLIFVLRKFKEEGKMKKGFELVKKLKLLRMVEKYPGIN